MLLEVPAMHNVVSAIVPHVFDAWSWCSSDVLEWRLPRGAALDCEHGIDGQNPAGLVFVLNEPLSWLPSELARLHAPGYAFEDELTLAPWAIDDATDLLYEHRLRPREALWLGAPTLEALVWGLHDWVHFHNHGPFDQPAWTELQCDLLALHWLRLNAARIGVEDRHIDGVARDLAALSGRRFAAESIPPLDFEALFAGAYPAP